MRIVNLETFRALPPSTLFSKYEPCCFEGLCIKDETIEVDFLTTSPLASAIVSRSSDVFVELLRKSEKDGSSIPMDFETLGRDGCFEDDQLFSIWEAEDLRALIERLEICLSVTPFHDIS